MSYAGNFDTARIYLSTGLKDRAAEYLRKVVAAVPEQERAGNAVYLKSLALLARLSLEESDRQRAAECIETGLRCKQDHADLLFLKALLYWDIQHYDEMFLALMSYLGAVTQAEAGEFDYEYASAKVVEEAMGSMLPLAFSKSASRENLAGAIAAQAGRSSSQLIQAVNQILQKVERHERDESEARDREARAAP